MIFWKYSAKISNELWQIVTKFSLIQLAVETCLASRHDKGLINEVWAGDIASHADKKGLTIVSKARIEETFRNGWFTAVVNQKKRSDTKNVNWNIDEGLRSLHIYRQNREGGKS